MTEYDETHGFQKLNNPIQNPKVQRSSKYMTFYQTITLSLSSEHVTAHVKVSVFNIIALIALRTHRSRLSILAFPYQV